MDAAAFERMTQVVDRVVSRRGTFPSLVGVGIVALTGRGTRTEAKPKKCKKPNTKCGKQGCCKNGAQVCLNGRCVAACQVTTNRKTKTLRLKGNCTATAPITIPDGFTLDGNRKTISLDESLDRFPNGVITNADGARTVTIRRLTINAVPLGQRDCAFTSVISLTAKKSEIADVTLQNLQCFRALFAGGGTTDTDPHTVRITHTTVKNWAVEGENAVVLAGFLEATIANCTFSGIPQGSGAITTFFASVTATISESTFTNVGTGVTVVTPGAVNVTNNQMQGVQTGVQALFATVDVTNNAIVGPGSGSSDAAFGVKFGFEASGSVSGNVISNFTSAGSCGIVVDADASADVTIGANDFTVPPPNATNVCDNRT